MKKLNYLFGIAAIAGAMFMTSCGQDDNPVTGAPQEEALFTYDFAAAAAAEENPDNLNGSANKGQAFYGWESESKTDSKRQDYKGYTWKEGSVLPEECHVWRRSDRINGNIVEGGLKCPSDKEMAIDGLSDGDIVQIFYTAAEEGQEIIWAVAVDANGETHGSTATVNGMLAVSGETTIPSGQKIKIRKAEKAEKSETGYIVFKVKKNMIISKVVISQAK